MPRETEADRFLQLRREQNEAQERKRAADSEGSMAEQYRNQRVQIRAELSVVVQLVAKTKPPYPDMEEVRLVKTGFLRNLFRIMFDAPPRISYKASWQIGTLYAGFDNGFESYYSEIPIYLLSNGDFCRNGRLHSLEEVVAWGCGSSCLRGLVELRYKLENPGKPPIS